MGPLLPPSQNESWCNNVFHLHFIFHAQPTHVHMTMTYFVRSKVVKKVANGNSDMANDDLFNK